MYTCITNCFTTTINVMLSLQVFQRFQRSTADSWKLKSRLPAEPTELLVYQKIHLAEILAGPMPQLTEMYQAYHL